MFYQLKAIRKKTKPPIWRRIFIPSNITFAQLAVILEEMLEYEISNQFEFEFYSRKERIVEWHGEETLIQDFYYSYFNAPDTYINEWLESEKSFTFRIRGKKGSLPEYRLEIEKMIDDIKYEDGDVMKTANHPMIGKQVSVKDDNFWSNPFCINEKMKRGYFIKDGKERYQSVFEIKKQIERGAGISFASTMINRDIHMEKSASALLKEMSDLLNEVMVTSDKKDAVVKHKCSLEEFLKAYSKEALLQLAKEEGLTFTSKRKDILVSEIKDFLLKPETLKERLLSVDASELDAFEDVIENGPFIPSEEQWDLLQSIYRLDYLCTFSDKTVQVAEEVIRVYQTIKAEGYRDYHRKASWLLKCMDVANVIYLVEPVEVLYQMFRQDTSIKSNYKVFLNTLAMIPEKVSECVLHENKVMYREIFVDGSYKNLERRRRKVDFYIPKKREIELIERDAYPSYEKSYQDLFEFLIKEIKCGENLAEHICRLAFYIFAGGGLVSKLMEKVNQENIKFDSKEQGEKFISLVNNVHNETRMAELNGHKPNEMKAVEKKSLIARKIQASQKADKKIYPNSPCPCGSGKKYKRCCGNGRVHF